MTRILVKRTGALGDVLEATAITRRLRHENFDAEIDVLTHYRNVFDNNSDVNETKLLRPEADYDRVIDLNGAFESRLRKLHPIDAYSEVAFGDRDTRHELFFYWNKASKRLLELIKSRPIVLHAARSWPIRTLPREWWQSLIDELRRREYNVVLTGTRQDWDGLVRATDLRDALSFHEQAALIDAAHCFICTESGPMILAQVTRTPIIPLLTMVPPEHIIHSRRRFRAYNNRINPGIYIVRANVPCVGCAADQPRETTYFDCKLGTRACVMPDAFDWKQIADLVDANAIAPVL